MTSVTVRYEDGTINIIAPDGLDLPHAERDPRSKTLRAAAFRYPELLEAMDDREIAYEDRLPDLPGLGLASAYELRDYQREALAAWTEHDRRGVLELPTGSGKTVIGIKALETVDEPALVVVPTVDLLSQWRDELRTEFDRPVGQLGGGEQRVEELTVATYDSAHLRADDIGDRFGLVVFDEVHHLGGPSYRDIARFLTAPSRLGLTATFERPDGAHEIVAELVGPVVYELSADDLAGEHLAPYDIKRLDVPLTEAERREYEANQKVFTDYLARSDIRMREGADYQQLVMRSGNDPEARRALLARQRARDVMFNAEAKLETLAEILDRHRDDRVLVFTAHNDLVYRIAERFLVPAITHRTAADERQRFLDRFRRGDVSRLVSSNVLDEGIDVPDANVAVILSGSGSEREFVQRLGRVLRPKEDGGRALLYEVVSRDTSEEHIAERRR